MSDPDFGRRHLALLLVLAGCGAGVTAPPSLPAPKAAQAVPESAPSPLMLEAFAVIATGEPPSSELVREVASGAMKLDAYITKLTESPGFTRRVAPNVVFREYVTAPPLFARRREYTLERTAEGVAYHLTPCKADKAVRVHPWWAMQTEIAVCPDSYRPTVVFDKRAGVACNSFLVSGDAKSTCGCGPNLMRCSRDLEHFKEVHQSLQEEVNRSIGHVVERDLPIEQAFLSNETFRDRNAELWYRAARIDSGDLPAAEAFRDLEEWPAEGRWSPRHESVAGEHAGVMTTPQIVMYNGFRRQRMRVLLDVLWGKGPASAGATAEGMLAVRTSATPTGRTGNVLDEGWEELAARPVCTECHARLDYGSQFFFGYPDARRASHFVPSLQKAGEGPLFVENIRDRRGVAPLNPHGFVEAAVRQPEFAAMIVRRLGDHVLGWRSEPEAREAIARTFGDTHSLKQTMRTALTQLAHRWQANPSAPSVVHAETTTPGAVEAGTGTLPATLRATLDARCVSCHSGGDRDLTATSFTRPMLLKLLDQVSSGRMPKDGGMSEGERTATVERLIATIWSEPQLRKEASRFYIDRARAPHVQEISAALRSIDIAAGSAPNPHPHMSDTMVSRDLSTLSPSFAAATSLQAMRACTAAGHKGADWDACFERTTQPARFILAPVSPEPKGVVAPRP